MDTTCAPIYRNIFLGWWQCTLVFVEDLEQFTSHILLWVHLIYDVFILWQAPKERFVDFVAHLNVNNIGMYFTSEM